jgi:hypothetical protein
VICYYVPILSHLIAVLKEDSALTKLREILFLCVTDGTICGPYFLKTRMFCQIKLNDAISFSIPIAK